MLARTCTWLFVASSAFPVAASLLRPEHRPRWLGGADVAGAAALVPAVVAVRASAASPIGGGDRLEAQRLTPRVLALVPVLLAGFLVVGNRLDWTVLVVGLSWRAWLYLSVLPALAASRRTGFPTERLPQP